jgi:hypothetical protein
MADCPASLSMAVCPAVALWGATIAALDSPSQTCSLRTPRIVDAAAGKLPRCATVASLGALG